MTHDEKNPKVLLSCATCAGLDRVGRGLQNMCCILRDMVARLLHEYVG